MKDFTSKLNLFETLSMLIPGSAIMLYIILVRFAQADIWFSENFNNAVVLSIIWFVLAYLIGIIHNIVMDWWWQPFRNNTAHISFVYNQLKGEAQNSHIDKYTLELSAEGGLSLFSCPCFLLRATSILIVTILSPLWRIFRCNPKGKHAIVGIVLDQYYIAYSIAEKRPNSAIVSLEQQVAFMRNMLLPLILLAPKILNLLIVCNISFPVDCYKTLISLFIIAMAFCIVKRQEKIYSCVFEDAEYLQE